MKATMKCIYCNKDCQGEYCSGECENKVMILEKSAEKYSVLFLLLLFASMLFLIPGIVFNDYLAAFFGAMFLVMGLTLIIFPFGTPETNKSWGVKKTVMVVRVMGIIMVTGGTASIFWNLFF
ncbi:MAG: hypothetical protein WCQ65_10295 [Fermentimonas sp.]